MTDETISGRTVGLAAAIREELIRLALPFTHDGPVLSEVKALVRETLWVTAAEQNEIMLREHARNMSEPVATEYTPEEGLHVAGR